MGRLEKKDRRRSYRAEADARNPAILPHPAHGKGNACGHQDDPHHQSGHILEQWPGVRREIDLSEIYSWRRRERRKRHLNLPNCGQCYGPEHSLSPSLHSRSFIPPPSCGSAAGLPDMNIARKPAVVTVVSVVSVVCGVPGGGLRGPSAILSRLEPPDHLRAGPPPEPLGQLRPCWPLARGDGRGHGDIDLARRRQAGAGTG